MNLFRCEWANGDVTFVLARDREEAVYYLDEFEDAAAPGVKLTQVPTSKARGFMVGFTPIVDEAGGDDGVSWSLDDEAMGETTYDVLGDPARALTKQQERAKRLESEGRAAAGVPKPTEH